MGDAVAEKDLVIILINTLPEKYEYFLIKALETITEDKITWDYVRDRLIHEFDKMQSRSAGVVKYDARQDALFSKRFQEQTNPFSPKKLKCFLLQKEGASCKRLLQEESRCKKVSNQESANRIESTHDSDQENPQLHCLQKVLLQTKTIGGLTLVLRST